jgi:phage tail tape-measure protein
MHASLRLRQGASDPSRSPIVAAGLVALLALGGCTMTETQQRTASGTGIGAAVGAAGGAIIGALAGKPGTGAAIGAATGAAVGGTGGYIHDQQTQRARAQTEISRCARRTSSSVCSRRPNGCASRTSACSRSCKSRSRTRHVAPLGGRGSLRIADRRSRQPRGRSGARVCVGAAICI